MRAVGWNAAVLGPRRAVPAEGPTGEIRRLPVVGAVASLPLLLGIGEERLRRAVLALDEGKLDGALRPRSILWKTSG